MIEENETKGFMLPRAEVLTLDNINVRGVSNKTTRTLYVDLGKEPFTGLPVFEITEEKRKIGTYIGNGESQQIIDIGFKPRGIGIKTVEIEPSAKELWVENYLGKDISVTWTDDGERITIKLNYNDITGVIS